MRNTLLGALFVSLLVVGLLAIASPVEAKDEATRGLRYPSLAPDGKAVTFAYRGDIWVAELEFITEPSPRELPRLRHRRTPLSPDIVHEARAQFR